MVPRSIRFCARAAATLTAASPVSIGSTGGLTAALLRIRLPFALGLGCRRALVGAPIIEGDLDPQLRARLEAHFKDCAHCSAIVDGTRNVVRLVGDGKTFDLPAGFSERLKKRLSTAGGATKKR